MNRNDIHLVNSDTSDHEAQPSRAPPIVIDSSASASENDTDTEYVYIDPVEEEAEEEQQEEEQQEEREADVAVSAAASSHGDNDSQLDDDTPITPLQQRTSDLVSRYLKRATQLATPDQLHSASRAIRAATTTTTTPVAAIDSTASSSDTGQATAGTATNSQEFSSDPSAGAGHIARPMRRSVRLKSLVADAPVRSRSNTPATRRPSSVTTDELTIDEVCVSTTSASSISSSQESAAAATASAAPAATNNVRLQQRLQVRLHRMSVDMAALSMSSGAEGPAPTGAPAPAPQSTATVSRSPRKQRDRTPSTKCLESFNLEDLRLSTPRRTQRTRTPCKRYDGGDGGAAERHGERTPRKRDAQPMETDEEEEEEDETGDATQQLPKSSMLYDQQLGDVAGAQMFSFRTPKKRNAMAALAAQAPRTPQTPQRRDKTTAAATATAGKLAQTPRTPRNATNQQPTKTPSRVRSVLKRELAKFQMPDTSGSDFSGDDSDEYKPQDDDDDDDEVDSDESDASGDAAAAATTPPKKQRYQPPTAPKTPSTTAASRPATRRRGQQDFVPECEDYFTHHTNKKATTSDRTLDRIRTPRLPHDDLFRLLAATALSDAHERAVYAMHREYRAHFGRWLFCLDEGFNIAVHGLGSKRQLLQQFHRDVLAEQTVLVVNGFFPSLTIKDVLDGIAVDVLGLQGLSRNLHEVVDAIGEELARDREQHVFLIVHNIDGVMLRNHRAQLVLSRLARLRQVHLIASLDHINAPLLWDHIKLANFNFAWWDCTTMLPYTEETAFENSMLVNNSGGLALSSMKNVFLSLTQNSRGIFVIIVRNQLQHKGNANFQGMPFKELYSRCREEFLVSSDVALRSQLTEFVDHQLVKQRRTADGIEHLMIPLDATLLQQFLELQENND